MLAQLPDSLLGTRDRPLLLLGFAGAFRRSELVGLDVAAGGTEDGHGYVEFTRDGLVVTLTRTRRGRGARSASPTGRTLRPARCAPSRTGWPRRT